MFLLVNTYTYVFFPQQATACTFTDIIRESTTHETPETVRGEKAEKSYTRRRSLNFPHFKGSLLATTNTKAHSAYEC